MLRLNPHDNQGIRYVLAAYLVEAERDDDLAALLQDYPDDGAAAWSWTAALVAFRKSGDGPQSRALLAQALSDNHHVAAYLLDELRVPKRLPPYISQGGKDEAIYYAIEYRSGWIKSRGAIDWLRANKPSAATKGRSRRPSRLH
jgi:hypothetical protein